MVQLVKQCRDYKSIADNELISHLMPSSTQLKHSMVPMVFFITIRKAINWMLFHGIWFSIAR